jgi:hypothetical protein
MRAQHRLSIAYQQFLFDGTNFTILLFSTMRSAGNGFHVIGMTAHRHGGAAPRRAGNGFRAI